MSDWVTTSTMLDQLGRRESAARERFAERFRTPLLAFAHKRGLPPGDAEDAAQEMLIAFMEAFQRGAYDRSRGRRDEADRPAADGSPALYGSICRRGCRTAAYWVRSKSTT